MRDSLKGSVGVVVGETLSGRLVSSSQSGYVFFWLKVFAHCPVLLALLY